MSDDLANRGAQDRSRIKLSEDHEIIYWTKALGISEVRLRSVLAEVGNSADAVRAKLKG